MLCLFFILSVGFFGFSEGAGILPDGPLDAAIGGSVLFQTTKTPETPVGVVTWRFGEITVGVSTSSEVTIVEQYQHRTKIFHSNVSLELSSLTAADSGEYGVNILPAGETGAITLRVHAPVSNVAIHPETLDVVEFGSLRLNCSSSGSSLSFLWIKDGSNVTASDRVQITDGGRLLSIVNVTRDDQGNYTCKVSNPVSSATSDPATVTVYSPVSNVTVDPETLNLVELNDSLRLSCSFSGSSLSFLWNKDGSEITASDRVQITDGGRTLTIVNVTRDDQGSYTCKVSNPVSSATSDPATVTVYYGPENVKITPPGNEYLVGSDITMMCSADSRPPAQFTWFLSGSQRLGTGSELKLMNVNVNQSGSYSCQAFNTKTLRYQTSEPSIIKVVATPPGPDCDTGCIVGIVVACVVVVAVAIGVGCYCVQKKKKKKKSTSTTTGGGARGNAGNKNEDLNYADVRFFRNKQGVSVPLGEQNTTTDYAEVRVNNKGPGPSSPPTYDDHMQRTKRSAPQPGVNGGPAHP